ncbi:hypothetical protein BH10PSE4_BH10PSE4_08640 [soil metagenome]
MINSGSLDLKPSEDFDPKFFSKYYGRSLALGENAFTFYCKNEAEDWCLPNLSKVMEIVDDVKTSPLLDESFIQSQLPIGLDVDPRAYFFTEGQRAMLNPSSGFTPRAYCAEYPDIALGRVCALRHYIHHGAAEGRSGFGLDAVRVSPGRKTRRADLPTILVVCHEASRTGAPLVGLNLMRELQHQFNIVAVMMREGVLANLFSEFAVASVVTGDHAGDIEAAAARILKDFAPQCAILNSMETTKFAPSLGRAGVGVISLIHEFAQYVYPIGTTATAICLSDRAIFPAQLVCDSALLELRRLGFDAPPSNIRIRSQGRSVVPLVSDDQGEPMDIDLLLGQGASGKRPFMVLGAGWVQMRKGVDLFIEAARLLKHQHKVDCKFVWVGANYNPFKDMGLSAYLADQIAKSDLEDVVLMVDEQASLGPFWRAADAFFMSSRLDPFPNVALDAIAEGVPVLCFEGGTGIASLAAEWPKHVTALPYGDTAAAAKRLAEIAKAPKALDLPLGLRDKLSFATYAADIAQEIKTLVATTSQRRAQVEALLANTEFDAALFQDTAPAWMKQPGVGLGATAEEVAAKATFSARAGIPLGLTGPNALNVIEPDGAWARQTHRTVRGDEGGRTSRILVASDDIATIARLARRAYVGAAGVEIRLVTRKLTTADIKPLYSVLDPRSISMTNLATEGDEAAAQSIADWIGMSAVECIRADDQDALDRSNIDATAVFASHPDLSLLVQGGRQPVDHEARPINDPDRALVTMPRALLNPGVCWIRTDNAAQKRAVAKELMRSLSPRQSPSDWIALVGAAAPVTGRWAMIQDKRRSLRGLSVLYPH